TQESLFSLKLNYAGFFTESPGKTYVNGDFSFFDCIDIDEFSIHELNDMLNYAGFFTESPGKTYVNEDFSFFDCIDIDEFLIHELNDMVKKLGFNGKTIMYYSFIKPDMNLDNGLYALGNDDDVRRMVECVIMELPDSVKPKNAPQSKIKPRRAISGSCAKKLMLDWKHNDANVIGESSSRNEDENETEDENRDDDSSDRDELVDEKNELVDVAVDMDHFNIANTNTIGNEDTPEFNADLEFDIGIDVIDNEEFESASNEDGIDMIRKRRIKQLKKQIKDLVHKHSIETRRELYLKNNDKVRVMTECRGTIHVFNNSSDVGPSQVKRSSQGDESSQSVKWTKRKIASTKGYTGPLKAKKVGGKPTLRRVVDNQCTWVLHVSKLQNSKTWQFLGFDDAFIKGPFPSQLLTTVGVDQRNGIYPLAYKIVETESREQKGIIPVIAELFPAAKHKYCLRHIHENMKLRWSGTVYKDLLWKAAIALTVPQFDEAIDNLKTFNKDCYNWLTKIPPMHWARSHFSGNKRTRYVTTNVGTSHTVMKAKKNDGHVKTGSSETAKKGKQATFADKAKKNANKGKKQV
ncbi:hypothetical protein Tco_1114836, partial [Tanacetum coccineum]